MYKFTMAAIKASNTISPYSEKIVTIPENGWKIVSKVWHLEKEETEN